MVVTSVHVYLAYNENYARPPTLTKERISICLDKHSGLSWNTKDNLVKQTMQLNVLGVNWDMNNKHTVPGTDSCKGNICQIVLLSWQSLFS